MSRSLFQILFCIGIAGVFLYRYIDKQNEVTELQLSLPQLAKEVRDLEKDNIALRYAIDQFESPIHLLELLRKPEYGHLRYPHYGEILIIPENAHE